MKNKSVFCQSLILGLSLGSFASAQTAQPNILLINIDDLGWTDLSCNGSSYYETPNIDALRAAGVWFPQAYAGASNSAPSRACMLTGQNTPRHGVFTVGTSDRGRASDRKLLTVPNRISLPEGYQLLPRVLHEAGYQTFHVGKWHVTDNPSTCGVDVNVGGNHAGHPRRYFSPYQNANLPDGEEGEFLCDRLGKEAASLIEHAAADKPFFLYFAPYAVHTPLQAKAELIAKYKNKPKTEAHNNPVYAALIQSMDENVGRVLQALRESGRWDNTLIIFTTDNGGVYDISRQWPLRAGKGSFYEGGVRVPFVVYQHGKFEKGEVSDAVVSQLDIFPTLMDAAGIDKNKLTLDGKSLLKVLKKGKDKKLADRPLFWHFPAYLEGGNAETTDRIFRTRPVSVIRKGDWKLIENYETDDYELYNLADDVSEKQDLSETNPKKVKELSDLLDQWKAEQGAPLPPGLNPKYKETK